MVYTTNRVRVPRAKRQVRRREISELTIRIGRRSTRKTTTKFYYYIYANVKLEFSVLYFRVRLTLRLNRQQ